MHIWAGCSNCAVCHSSCVNEERRGIINGQDFCSIEIDNFFGLIHRNKTLLWISMDLKKILHIRYTLYLHKLFLHCLDIDHHKLIIYIQLHVLRKYVISWQTLACVMQYMMHGIHCKYQIFLNLYAYLFISK